MKTLTKAQAEKRREQRRNWWRKNRSKAAMEKKAKATKPFTETNGKIINIINAYYVLRSSVSDGQIHFDLNKLLAAIISKQ